MSDCGWKACYYFQTLQMPLLNAWLVFLGSITKLPFYNQPPSPGSKTANPEALKRALRSMKGSVQVLSDSVLWDNRHSNVLWIPFIHKKLGTFQKVCLSWPRKVGWLGDAMLSFYSVSSIFIFNSSSWSQDHNWYLPSLSSTVHSKFPSSHPFWPWWLIWYDPRSHSSEV